MTIKTSRESFILSNSNLFKLPVFSLLRDVSFFPLHTLSASLQTAQHSFDAIHGTNKLTDEGNLPAKEKCPRLPACLHYYPLVVGLLHSVLLKLSFVCSRLLQLSRMHILSFPCADLA